MSETLTGHFGQMLRSLRAAAGLSQEELAEQAGLSARGIRALEAGDRKPRLETVRMLADALALPEAEQAELLATARPKRLHIRPLPAMTPVSQLPILARLPLAPTRLVGREADVAKACSALREIGSRLLTLTGPGGVGKTRVALAVAAELAADFCDGVAFVDLAPIREPDLIAPTLARTLGVPDEGGQPLTDALCAFVATRMLLIVLDNCEQILPGMPLVARLLAVSPGLRVLATSRERLHLRGERELPIEPLALPIVPGSDTELAVLAGLANVPSVRLFVERAEESSPGFTLDAGNVRAVSQICLRLEGLPLSIELAAAQMRNISAESLLDRLDRRLLVLNDGPRDLPERQHTLQNTITWSYDLLTHDEQALLRRLSVFAGGFTNDAARTVGAPLDPSGVDVLVGKSLLQRRHVLDGEPRFAMLEVVREFAAEQLAACGEATAARNGHAAWMTARMAEGASRVMATVPAADAARWLSQMQAEQDNLYAALTWLEHSCQWPDFLRLAATAAPFWEIQLQTAVGRDWLVRALDPTRSRDAPLALKAWAMRSLGRFSLNLGDYDGAETMLAAARAAYAELGDEAGGAATLRLLGAVAEYRGDDELCAARDEAALELFRFIGDSTGMAGSLDDLSDLAFRAGDLDKARRLAEESVAAARAGGSPVRLVGSLATLGEAANARGDWADAAAALREGLSLAWELGYDLGILDSIAILADVALRTGRQKRAARLLGAVRALADAHNLAKLPHHALYQRTEAEARLSLGEKEFASLWSTGRAMSPEQCVLEAMDQAELLTEGP